MILLQSYTVKGVRKKKFLFENAMIRAPFLEFFLNFSPYFIIRIPNSKFKTIYLLSEFQNVTDFKRYLVLFQNVLLRFGKKQSVTENVSKFSSKIKVSEFSFYTEQLQSLFSP